MMMDTCTRPTGWSTPLSPLRSCFTSRPQRRCNHRILAAVQTGGVRSANFPRSYNEAIRLAQDASQAALESGCKLIEVEFPTAGLASVAGDAEGTNEMSSNIRFLRQFCRTFQSRAERTRVFFPDDKEMLLASSAPADADAASEDGAEGSFVGSRFQLDYLTKPNGFSDMLINWGQPDVVDRAQDTDELFVMAHPSFNVNGAGIFVHHTQRTFLKIAEIIAIADLYEGTARQTERPIIVFNGELDRIRSGYYPKLFYPKLGRLAETFIPKFEPAFYIHNFKGRQGGVLYRVYPGPWQVMKRVNETDCLTVHTQETMPTLKEVALDILPNV